MENMMGILEKVESLLRSRRFWIHVAGAAIALLFVFNVVMQAFGGETVDVPETDALANRLIALAERIAAVIGAALVILRFLSSGSELIASYSTRPPGVRDRG